MFSNFKARLLSIAFSAMLLATIISAQAALADGAQVTRDDLSFSANGLTVLIPCTGQVVTLTGNIRSGSNQVINGNHFTLTVKTNPQGVTGVSTNGAKYVANGATGTNVAEGIIGQQYEVNFTNNFHLIGQGSNANYRVESRFHTTVDASGRLINTWSTLTATCS